MKVLSVLLIGLIAIYPHGFLYAEVILDKPTAIVTQTRNIRSPQQIIADFQATVDKIQFEQQSLHDQIEIKNKENTLLLRKLNAMSVRLVELQEELARKPKIQDIRMDDSPVNDLKKEKEAILQKYNQMLNEKMILKEEIRVLKENVQDLQQIENRSLVDLKSALDASEMKVKEQQVALDVLNNEKLNIDRMRLNTVEEKALLGRQLQDLQNQMAQAKLKDDQRTESMQAPLQIRIRDLSNQLDRMENEVRAKDAAILKFKNQAVQADNDLKKALMDKETLKQEIQRLTSTFNAAQGGRSEKISRLEENIEKAEEKINNLTAENIQAKETVSSSVTEQKILNLQIESLKQDLLKQRKFYESRLDQAKDPYVIQMESLQRALDFKQTEAQKRNQQLMDLKYKSALLVKQLTEVKAQRDLLEKSYKVLKSKTNIMDNKSTVTQMVSAQTRQLKEDLENKNRLLDEKTGIINQLVIQKKQQESEIDLLSKERNDLKVQLSNLKDAHSTLVNERKSVSLKQIQALEEKISVLSDNLKNREILFQEKEDRINQLSREKEVLTGKLNEIGNPKIDEQKTLMTKDIQALKGRINDLINELKNQEIVIKQKDRTIQKVTSQNQEFVSKLAMAKNEKNTPNEIRLSKGLKALQNKVAFLNNDLRNQKKEVVKKETVIRKLVSQKEELINQLALVKGRKNVNSNPDPSTESVILKEKIASLMNDLKSRESIIEKKEIQIKDLVNQKEEIVAKLLLIEGQKTPELADQFNGEIQMLEKKVSDLTEVLKKREALLKDREEIVNGLKRQNQEMKDKLITALKRNKTFSEPLSVGNTQVLEKKIDDLVNDLKERENEVQEKEKMINRLSKEKEGIAQQLSRAQDRKKAAQLSKEIKLLKDKLILLTRSLQAKESSAKRKDITLKKLADQKEQLARRLVMMEEQKKKVQTALLSKETQGLNAKIEVLLNDLKEREVIIKDKDVIIQQLTNQKEDISKKLMFLEDQRRILPQALPSKEIQSLEEKIVGLTNDLKAHKATIEKRESEIKILEKQKADISAELILAQDQKKIDQEVLSSKKIKNFEEKIAGLMGDLKDRETILEKNNAQIKRLEKQKEEVSVKLALLESQKKDVQEILPSKEIQILEEKISMLTNDLKDRERTIEKNETQIKELEKQKEEVLAKLALLESQKNVVQESVPLKEIQVLEGRIASLRNDLENRETTIEKKEEQIKDLKKQQEEISAKLVLVQEQSKINKDVLSSQKIKDFEEKIAGLRGDLSNREAIIEKNAAQIKLLEKQKEEVSTKLDLLEGQKKTVREALSSKEPLVLEEKIAALTNDLKDREKTIEKNEFQIKQLEKQKDEASARLVLFESQKKDVQEVLSSKDVQNLEEKIVVLGNQLKDRENIIEKNAAQINQLKGQKEELNAQLLALEKQNKTIQKVLSSKEIQELEEKILSLRNDLRDRESVLKDKDMFIKQLTNEKEEIINKLDSAESQKSTLQAMVNSLESQLSNVPQDEMKKEQQKLIVQVAELKGELKARMDETKVARLNVQKLEQQLKDERSGREKAQKDLAAFQERLKAQERVLESKIVEQTNPLHETIAKLNAKIKEQTEYLKEKESILEGLKLQKEKIQESLIASNSERQVLENKINELQTVSSMKKEEGDSLLKIQQAKESEVLESTQKQLTQALEDLRQKENQVQDSKKEIVDLNEKLAAVQQQKKQTQEELKNLNNQMVVIKKESNERIANIQKDLQKKIDDLQSNAASIKTVLNSKVDEIGSLNAKWVQLNTQNTQLSQDNEQLKLSLASLKDEKEDLARRLADLAGSKSEKARDDGKEVELLKGQILQLEKKQKESSDLVIKLSDERDHIKADLESLRSSYEQAKQALGQEVKEKENLQQAFKVEKTQFELKISELISKKDSLEQSQESLKDQLAKANQATNEQSDEVINEWKNKFDRISLELSKSQEDLKDRQNSTDELYKTNQQLTALLDTAKKDVIQRDKNLEKLGSQNKEFSNQVDLLTKERMGLEQRVKDLSAQVATIQSAKTGEITNVKSEATQKTAELAMKLADAVSQLQAGELKIQQLTEGKMALENQLVSANDVSKQSQEALRKSLQENEQLQKNYEAQLEGIKKDSLHLGKERDEQIMKVNELENVLKDEKKVSKDKETVFLNEIDQLKNLLAGKQEELTQVQSKSMELERSYQKVIAQLEEAQMKEKQSQERLQIAQADWIKKDSQGKETMAVLERELRAQIQDLTAQLSSAREETDKTLKAKETWAETIKSKEGEIQKLQGMLVDKDNEFEKKYQEVVQESSGVKTELQSEVQSLAKELKDSKVALDRLTKAKEQIEEELRSSKLEIARLQQEALLKQKDFETNQAQLTKEISDSKAVLQSQINDLNLKLNEAQKNVEVLTSQKDLLDKDLREREEIIVQLKTDKTKEIQSLSLAKDQVGQEIQEIKKLSQERIDQLTAQLNVSQEAVSQMTKIKKSLEEKIRNYDEKVEKLSQELSEKSLQSENTIKEEQRMSKENQDQWISQIDQLKNVIQEKDQEIKQAQLAYKELERTKNDINVQLDSLQLKEKENLEKLQSLQAVLAGKEAEGRQAIAELEKESRAKAEEITAQLSNARGEIIELKKVEDNLEKELQIREKAINTLQAQLAEKEKSFTENQTLAQQEMMDVKAQMGSQVEQLSQELKEKNESVERLSQLRNRLEEDLKNSEARTIQLQQQAIEQKELLENNQTKLSQEMANIKSTLQSKIDVLVADLKKSEARVGELTKSQAAIEEQLSTANNKVEGLEKEVALKENELNVIKQQAAQDADELKMSLQAQIDQLKTELNESRLNVEELTQAKSELQNNLQVAQAKEQKLQEIVMQKQNQLDSSKVQNSQAIEQLQNSLQSEIDQLTSNLKEVKGAAGQLSQENKQLSESLKKAEGRVEQLESEVINKENLVKNLQAKNEQDLELAKKGFDDQLSRLKDELVQSKGQIEALTNAKETLDSELKVLTQTRQTLTTNLEKTTKQLEDYTAKMPLQIAEAKKPLEEKIDVLVKTLGETQGELKTKQTSVDDLSKTVNGLEKTLVEAQSTNVKLVKESQEVKQNLENVRDEMKTKISQITQEFTDKNISLENSLKGKEEIIASLTQEKDNLSKQLASVSSEKQKLEQETKTLKAEMEQNERSLEGKIEAAKKPLLDEMTRFQKTLEEKELLISQKEEAFKKLSTELSTVLKGLAVVREERDNLSLRVKPLELQISSFPNEIAKAKKPLEDENGKLKIELEKVQGMLDVRVQGLEADIESRNSAYNQVVASSRELEKEIGRITQISDKLSQENQKLELKLSQKFQEDCGVAMQELQKPWKDKIEELKGLLEGRDKEIESFKNENARLNQELGGLVPAGR